MILIREFFVAKPGQASRLAKLMKEVADAGMFGKTRVMTDLTGEFNRVVLETEAQSLAEFESRIEEYGRNETLRQKMKGYTDLYLTGGREIYRIWS